MDIMDNEEASFHVQHLASKTLIELLMPKQDTNIQLKIGQTDEAKNSQEKMFAKMTEIAMGQQKLIEAGHSVEDVQRLNLKIDIEEPDEFIDIEEE
jgi:hypothetical protein